jgi:hypothetical protein
MAGLAFFETFTPASASAATAEFVPATKLKSAIPIIKR